MGYCKGCSGHARCECWRRQYHNKGLSRDGLWESWATAQLFCIVKWGDAIWTQHEMCVNWQGILGVWDYIELMWIGSNLATQ